MRFHPHLHCIVTGGGLTPDGTRWKATRQDYLFPVRVLSALFRGKLLAALNEAYKDGRLEVRGVEGLGDAADPDTAWRRLRRRLYRTRWVSYAKPPFAGSESVYRYLGRYTHRVGLSNRRLVSATGEAITFRTWGEQTATLHPHEFLRRFLLHVLPDGFVKMRHYGLLAPGNVNTRLATARALLQARRPTPAPTPATPPLTTEQPQVTSWRELLLRLTGLDVTRCQKCGGAISSHPLRPKDTS